MAWPDGLGSAARFCLTAAELRSSCIERGIAWEPLDDWRTLHARLALLDVEEDTERLRSGEDAATVQSEERSASPGVVFGRSTVSTLRRRCIDYALAFSISDDADELLRVLRDAMDAPPTLRRHRELIERLHEAMETQRELEATNAEQRALQLEQVEAQEPKRSSEPSRSSQSSRDGSRSTDRGAAWPAGLGSAASFSVPVAELRRICTEQDIPWSLSDDWRSLQVRLALRAAVDDAKDAMDAERLLATLGPAAIVRGAWLRRQDGQALPRRRMRELDEGLLRLDQLRDLRARFGVDALPVVSLVELWQDGDKKPRAMHEMVRHIIDALADMRLDRDALLKEDIDTTALRAARLPDFVIILPWAAVHQPLPADVEAARLAAVSEPSQRGSVIARPVTSEARLPSPHVIFGHSMKSKLRQRCSEFGVLFSIEHKTHELLQLLGDELNASPVSRRSRARKTEKEWSAYQRALLAEAEAQANLREMEEAEALEAKAEAQKVARARAKKAAASAFERAAAAERAAVERAAAESEAAVRAMVRTAVLRAAEREATRREEEARMLGQAVHRPGINSGLGSGRLRVEPKTTAEMWAEVGAEALTPEEMALANAKAEAKAKAAAEAKVEVKVEATSGEDSGEEESAVAVREVWGSWSTPPVCIVDSEEEEDEAAEREAEREAAVRAVMKVTVGRAAVRAARWVRAAEAARKSGVEMSVWMAAVRMQAAQRGIVGRDEARLREHAKDVEMQEWTAAVRVQAAQRGIIGRDEAKARQRTRDVESMAAVRVQAAHRGSAGRDEAKMRRRANDRVTSAVHLEATPNPLPPLPPASRTIDFAIAPPLELGPQTSPHAAPAIVRAPAAFRAAHEMLESTVQEIRTILELPPERFIRLRDRAVEYLMEGNADGALAKLDELLILCTERLGLVMGLLHPMCTQIRQCVCAILIAAQRHERAATEMRTELGHIEAILALSMELGLAEATLSLGKGSIFSKGILALGQELKLFNAILATDEAPGEKLGLAKAILHLASLREIELRGRLNQVVGDRWSWDWGIWGRDWTLHKASIMSLISHYQALRTRHETRGEQHSSKVATIIELATLLQSEGDLEGATLLFREAMEVRRETLGDRHQDTLQSINTLGELLRLRGDLQSAAPLLHEAMRTRSETLGDLHPDTLQSINNLCALLRAQGDHIGAMELYTAREARLKALRDAQGHVDERVWMVG